MKTAIEIFYTSPDTGEVVDSISLGEEYRIKIINENSVEAFKRLSCGKYDLHKNQPYTKTYQKIRAVVRDGLSLSEFKIFNIAQSFAVRFYTCELVDDNKEPITAERLIREADISERAGQEAIRSLIKRKILAKERRGRGYVYLANPFIFQCGNAVTREAFEVFKNSKWANIPIDGGD